MGGASASTRHPWEAHAMEMEYKDPSRRGRWVIMLGVVLAIAAGGAAFFLLNNVQQQAGQGQLQTVNVVVATRAIPPRKPIETDDLTLRAVPIDGTNAEGVVTDPNQLVGRILSVTVLPGQLVTTNLLASSSAGGQFSILKPEETVAPDSEAWRAVSITVPDDRAVGGVLGPQMTVDVFITATVNVPESVLAEGEFYTDQSTKITYQDMEILARSGSFYIVKATLAVAEEISHLQAAGNAQFSFALRPEADTRVLDLSALGATTNRIIERYGLPIPQTYPSGEGPLPSQPPIPEVTPPPSAAPSVSPSPSTTP
jgi:Flp pilus assembly protein CpaB